MKNNTIANMSAYESELGHAPFVNVAERLSESFEKISDSHVLFRTNVDSDEMWNAYLGGFPDEDRQHFNCNCCKAFIRRFGGLVYIDESMVKRSAMWTECDIDEQYNGPIAALRSVVEGRNAKIVRPFYSIEKEIGDREKGGWDHFFARVGKKSHKGKCFQPMYEIESEKRQNFIMLSRALDKYSMDHAKQAYSLLKSESMYRGEKVLGTAKAFYNLHKSISKNKAKRIQILWLYVASNPDGFCHISSSMIGTLLEDIESGDFNGDQVAKRFKDKMNPLQYQRPQSDPSTGNIDQAEKIVEKMGIAKSLERRFARIDEVPLIWEPKDGDEPDQEGGVFGHLKNKKKNAPIEAPEKRVTWNWFCKNVLTEAYKIEVDLPAYGACNFSGLLTAVHEDAPCIFQWGNHFSQYVYNRGSTPEQWNLSRGHVNVIGVAKGVHEWDGAVNKGHHGDYVLLILEGCKDTRMQSLAIFPECLIGELRGIRKTIEAFSRSGSLQGYEDASACGIRIQSDEQRSTASVYLRVETEIGVSRYLIDMWE